MQRIIKALKEGEKDPRKAVKKLELEADEAEREAEALRGIANTIRLVPADGIEISTPLAPGEAEGAGQSSQLPGEDRRRDSVPGGIDAVRRVMREGGVWTAKAMLAELTKRGWEPKEAKHPLPTVEAAMNRLYRVKNEIERVGRGEYTYKGFPGSPTLETLQSGRRAEP
jgi:hypothetical protein